MAKPEKRKTTKLKQPGFLTRMRASLNKGDSWLTYDLRNLLPGETVDQDALDELETQLLLSDVGVDATCLLYTSPSPRDKRQSRMPSSA